MAVVSLSRIQVRRGRKNQGSGLPQLASGEFGWAIDSQELYIGNGSVTEGAPAVGNTKILTDKDNVFDFVGDYVYRRGLTNDGVVVYPVQTGEQENQPVARTLQERLDDVVNLKNFGAEPGTDITIPLQRALDQLYLRNPLTVANRVVLNIDPGEYTINSTVYIPPYATIQGSGIDKTVIEFTETGDAFATVNSSRTIGETYNTIPELTDNLTSTTQPRSILLTGLTVKIPDNSTAFNLISCKDSVFVNISVEGLGSEHTDSLGFNLRNADTINGPVTQNNVFDQIKITSVFTAVESNYFVKDNTWKQCEFEDLEYGIRFGIGIINPNASPQNNRIQNSVFKIISKQAIHIENGVWNSSYQNRFFNVGNDRLPNKIPVTPIIQLDNIKNVSDQDWFERTYEVGLIDSNYIGADYFPEVQSDTFTEQPITIEKSITSGSTELLVLPADKSKSFEIEYVLVYDTIQGVRTGVIDITIDPENNVKSVVDDYDFLGSSGFSHSDYFELSLEDRISDPLGDEKVDAAVLSMLNSSNTGNIYFKIKTKR